MAAVILISAGSALVLSSGVSARSSNVSSDKPNNYVVFSNNSVAAAKTEAAMSSILGDQAVDLATEVTQKQSAQTAFYNDLSGKIEAAKRRLAKINKLVAYLKKQGSPIATAHYAELIIDLSEANGADYRVVVAISGVESGFCNANYKLYNCFGYLNGVTYANYDHALRNLVPKVAREYARVYGTNFVGLAKAYGMINWEYHSGRLRAFYNALS